MQLTCPHCDGLARVRSSNTVTRCTTELFCECMNTACRHTFVAYAEASHTLSPSATPHPLVLLPYSRHVKRRELVNELLHRHTAGDRPAANAPSAAPAAPAQAPASAAVTPTPAAAPGAALAPPAPTPAAQA